jgi:hypothetical protein
MWIGGTLDPDPPSLNFTGIIQWKLSFLVNWFLDLFSDVGKRPECQKNRDRLLGLICDRVNTEPLRETVLCQSFSSNIRKYLFDITLKWQEVIQVTHETALNIRVYF